MGAVGMNENFTCKINMFTFYGPKKGERWGNSGHFLRENYNQRGGVQ